MKTLPNPIPTDLPAPVALALLDLLNDLSEVLWRHYESELVPLIMEDLDQASDTPSELPDFDDDILF